MNATERQMRDLDEFVRANHEKLGPDQIGFYAVMRAGLEMRKQHRRLMRAQALNGVLALALAVSAEVSLPGLVTPMLAVGLLLSAVYYLAVCYTAYKMDRQF
jgi:hypothetical protein